MGNYLEPDDPNAFKDIEKKTPPVHYPVTDPVECPKCHGHGKWNLKLDAYGTGKHFQASCGQCNGWGYVQRGSKDETCIHEFRELSQDEARKAGVAHYGMCWHVYECNHCGKHVAQDSSD